MNELTRCGNLDATFTLQIRRMADVASKTTTACVRAFIYINEVRNYQNLVAERPKS